jgi:exodeoxyribonuclease VII small subunit
MAAKKKTLEESFDALDMILQELQNGDLTLEESFKKYEEGMKLIKTCHESIDKVEKKLIVIDSSKESEEN